jgi:hypothetical protein
MNSNIEEVENIHYNPIRKFNNIKNMLPDETSNILRNTNNNELKNMILNNNFSGMKNNNIILKKDLNINIKIDDEYYKNNIINAFKDKKEFINLIDLNTSVLSDYKNYEKEIIYDELKDNNFNKELEIPKQLVELQGQQELVELQGQQELVELQGQQELVELQGQQELVQLQGQQELVELQGQQELVQLLEQQKPTLHLKDNLQPISIENKLVKIPEEQNNFVEDKLNDNEIENIIEKNNELDTKKLLFDLENNKSKTLESQYNNIENELNKYDGLDYYNIFFNLLITFLFLLVIYYFTISSKNLNNTTSEVESLISDFNRM